MKTPIKELRCFIFDMDGTLYLGNTLLPGAAGLISCLQETGTDFYFFTNNSSRSPSEYVARLAGFGFQNIERRHIMTSGDVMLDYLKKNGFSRVCLIGTPALEEQFLSAGIRLATREEEEADAVVVGFDTTYNFEKATLACRFISKGVPFLATNIDRVCPLEGGLYLPDCGSICAMLEHATGVPPKFVGKPFMETVAYILRTADAPPEKTALVGDRLYTDIATAALGGLTGIAVLSGEVTLEELLSSDIRADYIFDSVQNLLDELKK